VVLISQYAILPLIGWASGISLYLTVALVGIGGRMGWLELPDSLGILTNPLVIGIAICLYAIEFIADKVPYVDSAWDSVHTFIRPAGAAIVGFMSGSDMGPLVQTSFALFTGTLALDTHAVKASSRAAINTSPEPVTNIVASLVEDSAVIGMFYFFVQHPFLALSAIVLFMVASFFFLRAMWLFVMKIFRKTPQSTAVAPSPSPKDPLITK
jgi:hypothetical protein